MAEMNIFGAFTFGSLIKTFLPGFVWLVAMVMVSVDLASLVWPQTSLWSYIQSKDQSALVLAIPASILLGLLSNVVVFMGLNDRLVREPMKRSDPNLFNLYQDLCRRIRDKCWDSLNCQDQGLQRTFSERIDPEIILLHTIGLDKLAYVREQYWYHLEFQLNLMVSLWALAAAIYLYAVLNLAVVEQLTVVLLASLIVLMTFGLLAAARKNYTRHVAKMASLMAVVLCGSDGSDE